MAQNPERSAHVDRRGSRHLAFLPIVGVTVLATMLSSCSLSGNPTEGSEDAWLIQTANLLQAPLALSSNGVSISLPSTGGTDVYSMALALSSFGDEIGRLPAEDLSGAKTQFHTAIQDQTLEDTVGGALYTAAEFLRADESTHFLSADDKASLGDLFDQGLSAMLGREPDVIDTYVFSQVASAFAPAQISSSSEAQSAIDRAANLCSLNPDAWMFLFAAATPGVEMPCDNATLEDLWSKALEALDLAIGRGGDVSAVECGQLRPLSEMWSKYWSDDDVKLDSLVTTLKTVTDRISAERVDDPLVCLSDVRSISTLLGAPPIVLTDQQAAYLSMVLKGGGNPVEYQLSTEGLASVVAVNRMANHIPLDLSAASELTTFEKLTIAVAGDAHWNEEVEALVDAVAKSPEVPGATRLVLTALVLGGDAACGIPEQSATADLLTQANSQSDVDAVALSLALRIVKGCTGQNNEALVSTALDGAKSFLEAAERDPILSVWEASAIYCALQPGSLAEPTSVWRDASASAGEFGGVELAPGEISFLRTQKLFELLRATEHDCEARGVLGYVE